MTVMLLVADRNSFQRTPRRVRCSIHTDLSCSPLSNPDIAIAILASLLACVSSLSELTPAERSREIYGLHQAIRGCRDISRRAVTKSQLPVSQLLLRGFLSGALLGFATTVAFTANAQGLPPFSARSSFPVGFAMIVVLGLELVTGSFAMLPAAFLAGRVAWSACWRI